MASRLATSLCGIPLKTPVLAASGTFAYGVELKDLVDLSALGGIVVKGLSLEPMDGNPPPRVWGDRGWHDQFDWLAEHRCAGLCDGQAARAAQRRYAIFANVFGYAVEDYVRSGPGPGGCRRPGGI
jgi:dihydroorotate dehydrogenase (NAD+) catalytic subunit